MAGFLLMYLPIYDWASHTLRRSYNQAHGPLILSILVWLFLSIRRPSLAVNPKPNFSAGAPIFALGQGYLHGVSGVVLKPISIGIIFVLDAILARVFLGFDRG